MNKNWNFRMLRRLCAYYRERAYAAEAELSEAYEEIRKLRTALEDSNYGISIDWAQRERMMIARNADNSIGRR